MNKFGLVGKNIEYSFSRNYFNEKFKRENLEYTYVNFDIDEITEFQNVIETNSELLGLNVTIPYKETIIPYLDKLSPEAHTIGAVNTIKIESNGMLVGHNTDYFGFQESLKPLLNNTHKAALILGTGGASKAIAYALKDLGIKSSFVSREAKEGVLSYMDLNKDIIAENSLIINTTPLGTFPNIETSPNIPYEYLTDKHLLYDLTYNPEVTAFMQKGIEFNAKTSNGFQMLVAQADKAWQIWTKK